MSYKKLLTYLVPLLIITGLTKNYFYYRAFNLRIFDYLELSETLSIITEYSVFILIAIPISWFMYFMLDMKKEQITEPKKNKDLISIAHKNQNFFKRFGLYLSRYWGASLMAIGLFIFMLLMRFEFVKRDWVIEAIFVTIVSLILFIVLLLEFRYKYKRLFEKVLDNEAGIILHYIGLFFIVMTFYTYVEINGTKDGKIKVKEYCIELTTGKEINTTTDFISIGQTKNYFFLYDRIKEETTIINKELFKEIKVK